MNRKRLGSLIAATVLYGGASIPAFALTELTVNGPAATLSFPGVGPAYEQELQFLVPLPQLTFDYLLVTSNPSGITFDTFDPNPFVLTTPGHQDFTGGFYDVYVYVQSFPAANAAFAALDTHIFGGTGTFQLSTSVPETSTWAMMLLGFAGLGFVAYRRTKNSDEAFNAA